MKVAPTRHDDVIGDHPTRRNVVIVRTKLQAIIVKAMIDAGLIVGPVRLLQVTQDAADPSQRDVAYQCRSFAGVTERTRTIARGRAGALGLSIYLWLLLWRARIHHWRVYVANLNWFSLALALRFSPGQQVFSFDDGTANIQQRDDSYLSRSATCRSGASGHIARWLFPEGCASFVRRRIARHCTIYPDFGNIVPTARIDTVAVDWAGMLAADDATRFPDNVTRIFLGSVYGELNERLHSNITPQQVDAAICWADLHIPHPRQPGSDKRLDVFLKYPAECIIDYYAKCHEVTVAHYNSSAVLPFLHNPHVHVIDLLSNGRQVDLRPF